MLGKLSTLFRSSKPDVTKSDVVITQQPPNVSLFKFCNNVLNTSLDGQELDAALEKFLNLEGYYGTCEPELMNGDVCIKPKCRQCVKSQLKYLIKTALRKDFENAIGKLVIQDA